MNWGLNRVNVRIWKTADIQRVGFISIKTRQVTAGNKRNGQSIGPNQWILVIISTHQTAY